jgi:hypothetical protein
VIRPSQSLFPSFPRFPQAQSTDFSMNSKEKNGRRGWGNGSTSWIWGHHQPTGEEAVKAYAEVSTSDGIGEGKMPHFSGAVSVTQWRVDWIRGTVQLIFTPARFSITRITQSIESKDYRFVLITTGIPHYASPFSLVGLL